MSELKYVVFSLNKERFGLAIETVERILPLQSVTRLPRTPKVLLGVFDLRGDTLPALDGHLRFGLEPTPDASNFIVVSTSYGRCGLKVDRVDGIFGFDEANIEAPTHWLADEAGTIAGVGKRNDELTLLLNTDAIVPKELRAKIGKVAAAA